MKKSYISVDLIKSQLENYINVPLTAKVNRGRNKTSVFDCKIVRLYPSVFRVEAEDSAHTFSYAELLCGTIKIALKEKVKPDEV